MQIFPAIALGNMDRCVPEKKGNRVIGMRCFETRPESIWAQLGMKPNDVLCGIDGMQITDPAMAFAKIGRLASPYSEDKNYAAEVCIIHDGKKVFHKVKNGDIKLK